MALPLVLLLPVGKAALGIAGKIAMKAYFLGKMAGLKTFLTSAVGASAANVSVSILAGACATAYIQSRVLGKTDQEAINATVAKGVGEDIARAIVKWIGLHT